MRYCRHADGHCLDGDTPCSECDAEGYPLDARRRLKRTADDMVKDIDDGQCFRVKRVKGEMERLVPVYNGRVKWNTEQGFTVMQTLLSCLGAEGEYLLWDEVNDAEMDVIAWIKNGYGNKSNVPIRHSVCREVVTSTRVAKIQQGSGVGCTCNYSQLKHWRNRRPEVVEWGRQRNFEVVTTESEWIQLCNGATYCPFLRCTTCNQTVTTASINNLRQGGGVGCTCNSAQARHWRYRRSEVVEWGKQRNFEVVATENEWIQTCDGNRYFPTLRCTACGETVTSTCLYSLQQGQGVGCTCNSTHASHWRNRRSEVVEWGRQRNFEVVTTEEEWIQTCDGNTYYPSLRCTACNELVTSTCISSLQQGQGIGCNGCRNKTESLLLKWLQARLPSATISTQHRGPKTTCDRHTHFDFLLTFSDGFGALLELDGAQHFWIAKRYYTDSGAARDLQKETWALQHGLCVIRLLQEDVWNDRHDWQGWIIRSMEAARGCGVARVFTPDAPEYRSDESAYVQQRT